MNILVTGAQGNLGRELATLLQSQGHDVTGTDIHDTDITQREAVEHAFAHIQPELVLHCAALTAVDYCAEHPNEALEANGFGTQNIALACQQYAAALLYISSNEVFDGRGQRAYWEYDPPAPINPYGYSKWVGEQVVRDLVPQHYIVRTSWLFSRGGQNFIHVILKYAQENQPLRVVTNEVASPTYTHDLAAAIARLITTRQYGIYHLVNAGRASRYEFARHALDLAGYADTPIEPIALEEFPRASRPPQYAALQNIAAARLGIVLRPWQDAVAVFLQTEGVIT